MANNWRKLKFLKKVNSLNVKSVENETGRWVHVLGLLCSGWLCCKIQNKKLEQKCCSSEADLTDSHLPMLWQIQLRQQLEDSKTS